MGTWSKNFKSFVQASSFSLVKYKKFLFQAQAAESSNGIVTLCSCKNLPFNFIINLVRAWLLVAVIRVLEGPNVLAETGTLLLLGGLMFEIRVMTIFSKFTVDDYNYFSGQSGSENTEHVKVDTDIGFSGASDKKSASAVTSSSPVTRWGTIEGGDN